MNNSGGHVHSHPINSSNILGVRTGGGHRKTFLLYRSVEEEIIHNEKERDSVLNEPNATMDLPLCDGYVLPDGKSCGSRVEIEGIFFCSGRKECPFDR